VLKAMIAKPSDHLLILTKNGKGLRFSCDQLRNQGRVTRGVRGIRLKPTDLVVNMLVVDDNKLLLIAGKNGLGIRTKFASFLPNGGGDMSDEASPRKRGGQGVTAMNTDAVCDAISVSEESEILMLTKKGQAVRCEVSNIRETNRGSKGVKLIGLSDRDHLVGVSEVVMLDEGINDDNPTELVSTEGEDHSHINE
jgi:DNA gyrase subunit A